MDLAILIGTWDGSAKMAEEILAITQEADRLGYSHVWIPELYGADAVSMMAWLLAQTRRVRIATSCRFPPGRRR